MCCQLHLLRPTGHPHGVLLESLWHVGVACNFSAVHEQLQRFAPMNCMHSRSTAPAQVVVAHGDVVPAPGGKAAFAAGALAFFQDVAALRRRPGARTRQLLLAGTVAAAVAAAALGGAALTGRLMWHLVRVLAG